ncbi:MAG: TIR domain-containing protein [Pseudomonadota bacterium]
MTRIFISHSSKDNAAATALDGWLRSSGWDQVFLDFDPERGIAAGERWEEALTKAASRCEAVVFLISRNWLDSSWCTREFNLARRLSKRLFGVLIEDIAISDIPSGFTSCWQFADLASGEDHEIFPVTVPPGGRLEHVTFSKGGLARLRAGLLKAGLDQSFFAWPPENEPDRAPYRGLLPLDADDAGIFFGREAPIVEAIDTLRDLADRAAPRLFVIQGSSGAGKSSFLRAGLLPRLIREDRLFAALPVTRPARSAMLGETGFAEALLAALDAADVPETRAAMRTLITNPQALVERLSAIAEFHHVPTVPGETEGRPPAILIPIDQAEELFQADGADESERFLSLLRHLTEEDRVAEPGNAPLRVIVLFTIRTDAYVPLQTAPAFAELRQTVFSLAPMPRGAFKSVIEGPANRLAASESRSLRIEPALTEALLADIEKGGGRDALPLLAFTLLRLHSDHGGDGKLGLDDYVASGRLAGAIEAAVSNALEAADADPAVPRDHEARLALLRRGLIPWLAGIDPATKLARRKVPRLSEVPEEARPLIRYLIDARLLSTDHPPGADEPTIELAHESVLRQWALLAGWLAEDIGFLSSLEGVLSATRDWEANARSDAWLNHTAGRLEDAERLLPLPYMHGEARDQDKRRGVEIGGKLGAAERAYLSACRAAEDARRNRELEDARRLAAEAVRRARAERIGTLVAFALMAVAVGFGGFAMYQRSVALDAERAALEARDAEVLATDAANAARQAEAAAAAEARIRERDAYLALSSVAIREDDPIVATAYAFAAWQLSGADQPEPPIAAALSASLPDQPRLVSWSLPVEAPPEAIAANADDSRLAVSTGGREITLVDTATRAPLATFDSSGPAIDLDFAKDAARLAVLTRAEVAIYEIASEVPYLAWRAPLPDLGILTPRFDQGAARRNAAPASRPTRVALSPDGTSVAVGVGPERGLLVFEESASDPVFVEVPSETDYGTDNPQFRDMSTLDARFLPGGGGILHLARKGLTLLPDFRWGSERMLFADRTDGLWFSTRSLLTALAAFDNEVEQSFSTRQFAVAGDDVGRVWMWNLSRSPARNGWPSTWSQLVSSTPIRSVAIDPDGYRIFVLSDDGYLTRLVAQDGVIIDRIRLPVDEVSGLISTRAGNAVSMYTDDGQIVEILLPVKGRTSAADGVFAINQDGEEAFVGNMEKDLRRVGDRYSLLPGCCFTSMTVSRDGTMLATSSNTPTFYDDGTKSFLARNFTGLFDSFTEGPGQGGYSFVPLDETLPLEEELVLSFDPGWNAVAFVTGTAEIVGGDDAGALFRVDLATHTVVDEVPAHTGAVNALIDSNAIGQIVSASDDGTLRSWSAPDLSSVKTVDLGPSPVLALASLRDGAVVAAGTADGGVYLVDVESAEVTMQLRVSEDPILALGGARAGPHLAIGTAGGEILLADTEAGVIVRKPVAEGFRGRQLILDETAGRLHYLSDDDVYTTSIREITETSLRNYICGTIPLENRPQTLSADIHTFVQAACPSD